VRRLITVTVAGLAMGAAVPSVAHAALPETFTPVVGHNPRWLSRAVNALEAQSQVFRRHWSSWDQVAGEAFFDVDGIPTYIGTPKELTALGQGAWVTYMEQRCYVGIHVYRFKPEPPPHGLFVATRPKVIVLTSAQWLAKCRYRFSVKSDEISLSHEVLETLADPKANEFNQSTFWRINKIGVEVADPVEHHGYYDSIHGAWLSDFTLPSYYLNDQHGPWDFMGVLKGPWPARD